MTNSDLTAPLATPKKKPKSHYFIRKLLEQYETIEGDGISARYLYKLCYDNLPKSWLIESETDRYAMFLMIMDAWIDYLGYDTFTQENEVHYQIGLRGRTAV